MHQNDRVRTRLLLLLIIPVISVCASYGQTTNDIRLSIRLLPVQTLVINHAGAKKAIALLNPDKEEDPLAMFPGAASVTAFSPGGYQVSIKPAIAANLPVTASVYSGPGKAEKPAPLFKKKNGAHHSSYLPDLDADSVICRHMLYTVTTR